jgi:transcriptional regulator with XRE-family HTH domain
MDDEFVTWLNRAVGEAGWTWAELAKRSGISTSMVSMVISGQRHPGPEFCVGVARAFGELPERVMRIAGLLPPLPPSVQEESEVIQQLRRISATDRDAVIRMVRGLASGASPPRRQLDVSALRQSSNDAGNDLDKFLHEPNPDNPYACALSALAELLPTDALMEFALRLAQEAREYESNNAAVTGCGEREVAGQHAP